MKSIVVLSGEPVEKKVRARRIGQYYKSQGHSVVYAGPGEPGMSSEALRKAKPIDGCDTFTINPQRLHKVATELVDFKPDLLVAADPDAAFMLLHSQIISLDPLSLASPELFRPLEKPPGLNCKWALDCMEYFYDCVGLGATQGQLWARASRLTEASKVFDFRSCASPSAARAYEQKTRLDWDEIYNSPFKWSTQNLKKDALNQHLQTKKPILCYQGYGSPLRLWHTAAVAAQQTGWQFVAFMEPRQTYPGYATAEQITRDMGGQIFPLVPYPHEPSDVPHLLDYMAGCDAGFNSVTQDFMNHKVALQNKFFEHTMAGCPVVNCPTPDATVLIKKYGLGKTYDMTIKGLCETLEEMKSFGRPVVDEFVEDFCFENANGPTLDRWLK